MPFDISNVAAADAPAIAAIWSDAFAGDGVDAMVWNGVSKNDRMRWALNFAALHINQLFDQPVEQRRLYVLKASDTATGEMAAFAVWELVAADALRGKLPTPPLVDLPESANKKLNNDFCDMLNAAHCRLMSGRAHYHLVLLATAPSYWRQGAARALATWGTAAADCAGICAYVEASSRGSRDLYASCNWNVAETLNMGLEEYGSRGTLEQWCMVREPNRPEDNPEN